MATRDEALRMLEEAERDGKVNRARVLRERLGLPPAEAERPVQPTGFEDSFLDEVGNIVSGLPGNAVSGLAEMGSATGRALAQGLDFLGPGTANAALRLAGSDYQLPTFEEGFDAIPGSQGGFMAAGTPRDVVRGFGGALPATLGMAPVGGRNLASPVGALMEFAGLGAAAPASTVAPLAFGPSQDALGYLDQFAYREGPQAMTPAAAPTPRPTLPQTASRQAIGEIIEEAPESATRAGFSLEPYTGRVVPSAPARESMKQGLDEAFTSMIQSANPETRAKLSEMLDAVEQGQQFYRARTERRPFDIVGASLGERLDVLRRVNRDAGNRIDTIAEGLKGQPINVKPAVDKFVDGMRKMGVDFGDREAISLGFDQSDIALAKGPTKQLRELVEHMAKGEPGVPPDAYKIHQLKRQIDELVTYGKSKRGLGGRTEGLIKQLRRDLDSALDAQFPEYNRVNTEYSETIKQLDTLQELAGKKNDIYGDTADRVIGNLLRRVESNAQSGPRVIRVMDDIGTVAERYASGVGQDVMPYRGALSDAPDVPQNFRDDIRAQIGMADQLNRLFGTPAGTSFQGEIAKVVEKGAEDALTGGTTLTGLALNTLKAGRDRARGINEENAMRALRALLGGQ